MIDNKIPKIFSLVRTKRTQKHQKAKTCRKVGNGSILIREEEEVEEDKKKKKKSRCVVKTLGHENI
jgi:hypothetical protein